jgi:hypothetical protein
MYKVEKTPKALLAKRHSVKNKLYPVLELKIGEMFKAPANEKSPIYNTIRHRTVYTKELGGRKFSIRTIDKDTVACIRIE